MADKNLDIHITTSADQTGAKDAARQLEDLGRKGKAAGNNVAAGFTKGNEALKGSAHTLRGLALQFPLLSRAASLFVTPLTATIGVLGAGFELLRRRIEAVGDALGAETQFQGLQNFAQKQREIVEGAILEWNKFERALRRVREEADSVAESTNRALGRIGTGASGAREVHRANVRLQEAQIDRAEAEGRVSPAAARVMRARLGVSAAAEEERINQREVQLRGHAMGQKAFELRRDADKAREEARALQPQVVADEVERARLEAQRAADRTNLEALNKDIAAGQAFLESEGTVFGSPTQAAVDMRRKLERLGAARGLLEQKLQSPDYLRLDAMNARRERLESLQGSALKSESAARGALSELHEFSWAENQGRNVRRVINTLGQATATEGQLAAAIRDLDSGIAGMNTNVNELLRLAGELKAMQKRQQSQITGLAND